MSSRKVMSAKLSLNLNLDTWIHSPNCTEFHSRGSTLRGNPDAQNGGFSEVFYWIEQKQCHQEQHHGHIRGHASASRNTASAKAEFPKGDTETPPWQLPCILGRKFPLAL